MRRLLVPLGILVVLLAAAGAVLAAVSIGDGDEEGSQAQHRVRPYDDHQRVRDHIFDRLPREEPLLPELRGGPFVGIAVAKQDGSVVVERVVRASPAARAGIEAGDVIEAIDDTPVSHPEDVAEIVQASEPGDTLTFHVRRGGEEHAIDVEVGGRPNSFGKRLRPLFPQGSLRGLLHELHLDDVLSNPLERIAEAAITYLDEDGNPQTLRVVNGIITKVSNGRITVVYRGGGAQQEFSITNDTHVLVGLQPGTADALEVDQRVLVVVRGGQLEALAVVAFPAKNED